MPIPHPKKSQSEIYLDNLLNEVKMNMGKEFHKKLNDAIAAENQKNYTIGFRKGYFR